MTLLEAYELWLLEHCCCLILYVEASMYFRRYSDGGSMLCTAIDRPSFMGSISHPGKNVSIQDGGFLFQQLPLITILP